MGPSPRSRAAIPAKPSTRPRRTSSPSAGGRLEEWAGRIQSIGQVAERLTARIEALIDSSPQLAGDFARFLKGLQDTLNPAVSRDDVVEMLTQHILTLPVFQALFADTGFLDSNAVGKALQNIVDRLDTAAVDSETEGLTAFYENVRERIRLAKSDKSKQDIIRNLYDTFFHSAFPRMAERLGREPSPSQAEKPTAKHRSHNLQEQGGGLALETDPDVESVGFDAGFTPDDYNLQAPNLAVGNVPDTPGWIPGAPPLAVEYADVGQNEQDLQAKIRILLGRGHAMFGSCVLPDRAGSRCMNVTSPFAWFAPERS